ncbi:hypothetical protein ACFX2I_008235 [Malus domestica]
MLFHFFIEVRYIWYRKSVDSVSDVFFGNVVNDVFVSSYIGLPAIVARSTMLASKSDSVVLPLVARYVQDIDGAINASNSEGADFLMYDIAGQENVLLALNSLFKTVKLPIFVTFTSYNALYKKENVDAHDGPIDSTSVAGFLKLENREKKFIEAEISVLLKAINVIQKAAPLMEEVSLLVDAVSQIDEPFLLVIVASQLLLMPFSGINISRYTEMDAGEEQRCERHPDGQYICHLPAPILKQMNVVDTPGTNVILQRQQRLTEEFVPRADLLLFVISADRPLTESEKRPVNMMVLSVSASQFSSCCLYLNALFLQLEEATSFIKENTQKLLNTEHVTLFPVSARSALEAKLSASMFGKDYAELSVSDAQWKSNGSTSTGMERKKIKLETPIAIAEKLLSACETLVTQDCRYAKQDLASINDTRSS